MHLEAASTRPVAALAALQVLQVACCSPWSMHPVTFCCDFLIRATTITRWHSTHANLDSTNSPTQFELRGDAPFKACTRVLLHSVPLPPSSLTLFIPTPQLVVDGVA